MLRQWMSCDETDAETGSNLSVQSAAVWLQCPMCRVRVRVSALTLTVTLLYCCTVYCTVVLCTETGSNLSVQSAAVWLQCPMCWGRVSTSSNTQGQPVIQVHVRSGHATEGQLISCLCYYSSSSQFDCSSWIFSWESSSHLVVCSYGSHHVMYSKSKEVNLVILV